MKVGVIGGRGFVGSAFSRYLHKNSIRHEIIDKENYSSHVGAEFDILINANGNSKKFLANQEPKREFSETVSAVQSSLIDFKYSKYILCSTVDVYNNLKDPNHNREDVEIDPSSLSKYGLHKLLAEELVRNYASSWLIFRFGGFVGPGLKKNSIYDLLNGVPLRVNIDSAYQYLPTDSAAEAVFKIALTGLDKQVFNLCGDGLVTLREVVDVLLPEYRLEYFSANPPVERYEIHLGKILGQVEIPRTRDSVFDFVKNYLEK